MTVLVFTDHSDCPVCHGDDQVRLLVVRPRELGGPATADQIGSVIVCPLLPRLPDLFFAVPRGGGPRATA